MTDEELEQTLQDLSQDIDRLSNTEKPLTKEEKKHQTVLSAQREILLKIKNARQKNSMTEEMRHTMLYGLVTSLGEKHPYLMSILIADHKWNTFM